ncbi:MAG: DsbA family protein, partial [Bdellovibrionota bacterium]
MLARCIAKDDAGKYFAVIDMMFKKLDEWSLPADPLQGFLRVFRYPWHERRVGRDLSQGSGSIRQAIRR